MKEPSTHLVQLMVLTIVVLIFGATCVDRMEQARRAFVRDLSPAERAYVAVTHLCTTRAGHVAATTQATLQEAIRIAQSRDTIAWGRLLVERPGLLPLTPNRRVTVDSVAGSFLRIRPVGHTGWLWVLDGAVDC